MATKMESNESYINKLRSKLRDLKISYQFLETQLQNNPSSDILDYYREEINETQSMLNVALSSSEL